MIGHKPAGLSQRQRLLFETNINWLHQAISVIKDLDDAAYTAHRTGSHFRHIIDLYDCFLDGAVSGHIDYDARARDESIARYSRVALDKLQSLAGRMAAHESLCRDHVVFVRMEDADALDLEDPFLMSTIGRELQALSSHTVHHFALIAMNLRHLGIRVPPNFGAAPSTLRHENTRAMAMMAAEAA
ncbi:MAG: hypothetical protein FJW40_22700 [Acidobacteria bacterium]|nr:hypothetical protein [Acidobacteriota bacterium]